MVTASVWFGRSDQPLETLETLAPYNGVAVDLQTPVIVPEGTGLARRPPATLPESRPATEWGIVGQGRMRAA